MQNDVSNANGGAAVPYQHEREHIHYIVLTLVWGTNRGVPIFSEERFKELCKQLILTECQKRRWRVAWLEIQPDNVRIRMQIWWDQSAGDVVSRLKSSSVGVKEQWERESGNRLRAMWTNGFFASIEERPNEEVIQQHLLSDRNK